MTAVATASIQSELQTEEPYVPTRVTRLRRGNEQNKTVTNVTAQVQEHSVTEEVVAMSSANTSSDKGRGTVATNGVDTPTPGGGLQSEKSMEGRNRADPDNISTSGGVEGDNDDGKVLTEADNDDGGPGDQEDSGDEENSAESVVVEEWQDATASIAGGSMADAATRNNCVYVFPSIAAPGD